MKSTNNTEKVLVHQLKRYTNLAFVTRQQLDIIRLNKELKGRYEKWLELLVKKNKKQVCL